MTSVAGHVVLWAVRLSVHFHATSVFRSTVNSKSWTESANTVSAVSIGKLELKGISEKFQVMQLALMQ